MVVFGPQTRPFPGGRGATLLLICMHARWFIPINWRISANGADSVGSERESKYCVSSMFKAPEISYQKSSTWCACIATNLDLPHPHDSIVGRIQ